MTLTRQNCNITPPRLIAWAALAGCYNQAGIPSLIHLDGFMSASHTIGTSFYGGQWWGGLVPAGSDCQSANPAICLPYLSFSSDSGLCKTNQKDTVMAKISQVFPRLIIVHLLCLFFTLLQNLTPDNHWVIDEVIAGGVA